MAVADERREGCDGCGRVVRLEELTTVTMPDGDRIACCPRCEPHARNAAEKLSAIDRQQQRCDGCTKTFQRTNLEDVVLRDGAVISCCPDCLSEVPGQGSGQTVTGSTELATPRNLCSQCHESYSTELFHVTTIDDRTEELCPTCKETAERKGIVKSVKMRKSEAREILGVEENATTEAIREAFITQIKSAHPDQKSGTQSAFKLVKEAYERLT